MWTSAGAAPQPLEVELHACNAWAYNVLRDNSTPYGTYLMGWALGMGSNHARGGTDRV